MAKQKVTSDAGKSSNHNVMVIGKDITYLDVLAHAKLLDSEPDRSTSVKEVSE